MNYERVEGRIVASGGRAQTFRGFIGEKVDSGFGYSRACGKEVGETDMWGSRDGTLMRFIFLMIGLTKCSH